MDTVPVFDEAKHTYTDPTDGFKYTSVTRWLEKFKPTFNEQTMAKKIAAREGVTVDIVLEEWRKKREDSKTFGTTIHKELEYFYKNGKLKDTKYEPIITEFNELQLSLNSKICFYEKLVFNKKLGIAGMSDIIRHNEDKKTFNVFDFKTNKKLRVCSAYNEYMLSPLTNYPCSEYFSYALQLSMYAYLYKSMTGLEPLRLKIFWYKRVEPENYNNLKGKWEIFNIPYMEEEIIRCLKYEKTVVG